SESQFRRIRCRARFSESVPRSVSATAGLRPAGRTNASAPTRSTSRTAPAALRILILRIPRYNFAEHQPKVRRHCQIAALVRLRPIEPRPAPINFAAFNRPAEDEHHVGVAVVG